MRLDIDWVIPFGNGSRYNNAELLLCLRSLERWIKPGRIVVVGSDPGFLSDKVLFIPNAPDADEKEKRIMQQFKLACMDDRVSGEFVMCNDDYVFLKMVEPGYYHKGSLGDAMKMFSGSPYYGNLLATDVALKGRGCSTWNCDVHRPMIYDKEKLLRVISSYDWNVPQGYCLKSLYCNTLGIESVKIDDNKVHSGSKNWNAFMDAGWDMVSLSDEIGWNCINWFLSLFPNKSLYET